MRVKKLFSTAGLILALAVWPLLAAACSDSPPAGGQAGGDAAEKQSAPLELAANDPNFFSLICEYESPAIIKQAIELGADPNAMTMSDDGPLMTALMYAIISETEAVEKAAVLLNAGADPNARAILGLTAIYFAVEKNNLDILKLLLEHGADINSADEAGDTPLMEAINEFDRWSGEEQWDMLKLLLAGGADVNRKNHLKHTVLHEVSKASPPEILKLILEAGAEVNAADEKSITPLMLAAANNTHPESVRLLLESGADPSLKNDEGQNALDAAKDNKSQAAAEIEAMLQEALSK